MREARKYIEQLFGDRYFDGNHEARAVEQKVLDAIDKQTALKPVIAKREVVCPTCRTLVGSTPYCAYCGQKLDHGSADADENSLTETEKLKIEIEALRIANAKMYEAFLKQPEEIFKEIETDISDDISRLLITLKLREGETTDVNDHDLLIGYGKLYAFRIVEEHISNFKKKYVESENDNG